MRHDARKYLWDIREAGQAIQRFCVNKSLEDFREDEQLVAAVERKFGIIGEAMSRLSKLRPELVLTITDINKIIGLRHILVHDYDRIKDETLWEIIEKHLPVLLREIDGLIELA